jgi:hypothetical protein
MSNYTDPLTKAELERELAKLRTELRDLKSQMTTWRGDVSLWLCVLFALIMLVAGMSNYDSHSSRAAATTAAAVARFPQERR